MRNIWILILILWDYNINAQTDYPVKETWCTGTRTDNPTNYSWQQVSAEQVIDI